MNDLPVLDFDWMPGVRCHCCLVPLLAEENGPVESHGQEVHPLCTRIRLNSLNLESRGRLTYPTVVGDVEARSRVEGVYNE